jgi:hypothetical protein
MLLGLKPHRLFVFTAILDFAALFIVVVETENQSLTIEVSSGDL